MGRRGTGDMQGRMQGGTQIHTRDGSSRRHCQCPRHPDHCRRRPDRCRRPDHCRRRPRATCRGIRSRRSTWSLMCLSMWRRFQWQPPRGPAKAACRNLRCMIRGGGRRGEGGGWIKCGGRVLVAALVRDGMVGPFAVNRFAAMQYIREEFMARVIPCHFLFLLAKPTPTKSFLFFTLFVF